MAFAARSWLRTANSSHCSRLKPSTLAMRSAEMPWGTVGYFSRKAGLPPSRVEGAMAFSSTGQRDIDSTPPPTTRSCMPARMPMAASVTACWPEPQKRLSVKPGVVYGQPAASTESLPMHSP